jgi:hypothetical protein
MNLYGFVGNDPIWHIDVIGLAKKKCSFDVTGGHADQIDEAEQWFNEWGKDTECDRFYGASCFRSPNGGLVWPTPESRDERGQKDDSTIGELLKMKIQQAENDAEAKCGEKEKCCSKVELTVSCKPSPSMQTAREKDPLAKRACNYSNTYKCPNSKGKGGEWEKEKFK